MIWPYAQIRHLARLGTGHTPSRSVPEYWENCTIPWLTLADVHKLRDGTETTIEETSERISALGVANSSAVPHPEGTVAMSRTASVGFTCILGTRMATSQDFVTWTCSEKLDNRYLLWALRGERFQILSRMQGSTHKTIYMPDLEDLRVPLPPLAEQRAIADYLDAETARIDALIAKKQQLIHLLEERHNLAIAELALGRLSGARDFRSSNVEWIGQIPAGWEVQRLNRIARLESGHTPSRTRPELWERADKHWITLNDVGAIKESEYIEDTVNRISAAGIAASSARVLPADTVVLSRDATVGRVGIMKSPMATSQHFAAWVCSKRLDPRFLWLLMRFPMQRFFNQFNDGATLRTIGMPHIRAFVVPVAPLETQHQIVATAKRQREDHQQLRSGLHKQVILLSERRQALITAAVTGEFAVSGGV